MAQAAIVQSEFEVYVELGGPDLNRVHGGLRGNTVQALSNQNFNMLKLQLLAQTVGPGLILSYHYQHVVSMFCLAILRPLLD